MSVKLHLLNVVHKSMCNVLVDEVHHHLTEKQSAGRFIWPG